MSNSKYVRDCTKVVSDVKTPRQPKFAMRDHNDKPVERRYLRLQTSKLAETFNRTKSVPDYDFVLQTDMFGPEELMLRRVADFIDRHNSRRNESDNFKFCLKLFEDVALMVRLFSKATDKEGRILAVIAFAKLRSKNSLIYDIGSGLIGYFNELFGSDDESFVAQSSDFIALSRTILDKWDEVRASPLYKKLYKFIMYAMSMSLFAKIGIKMEKFGFDQVAQEAIRKKYHMGPDFVRTFFDTLIFICERGQQCWKTKSMAPLFHSGKSYDEWYADAAKIKRLAPFLNNLEPHGYTTFQYHAELRDLILKGDSIVKHAQQMKEFDAKFLAMLLSDLKLILTEITTKKAAMQDRRAPFSILLAGGTSVNKSGLTKLLYYHYGKMFGLPTDAEYKYTRNSIDQYWVNFNTSQWCVQLDDIAFMRPTAAPQGDPTLMEMLQVVNNVPFVPIQAALEDKGRTPLLSRFVIATTNTEKLNVHAYFSCPAAISRRLPWVVSVEPHPDFLKSDGTLDTSKASVYTRDLQDGEYPNFWKLTVKQVVVSPGTNGAELVPVETFTDILKFIKWFSQVAKSYESTQDSAMLADQKMATVTLCSECSLPQQHCDCQHNPQLVAQSDNGASVIPYRVQVIKSTWEALKPSIVHEGKALVDEIHSNGSKMQILKLRFWLFILMLYLYVPFFAEITDFLFGTSWLYKRLSSVAWEQGYFRFYLQCLGKRVQDKVTLHSFFGSLLIVVSSGLMLKKAYDQISVWFTSPRGVDPYQTSDIDVPDQSFYAQGSNESKLAGKEPVIEEKQKTQVWVKEDYQTTQFEITPTISSYLGLAPEKLEEVLLRNCVAFYSTPIDDPTPRYPVRAICLGGKVYMTNNHALPHYTEFDLHIIRSSEKGVTPNITIRVTQDLIHRVPSKDIAVIVLRGLQPKKDITELFGRSTLRGNHKGFYLGVSSHGEPDKISVDNINLVTQPLKKNAHSDEYLLNEKGDRILIPVWVGRSHRLTVRGDCGMALVSQSTVGPIILGIHCGGNEQGMTAAIFVSREMAKEFLKLQPYLVEPSEPMLVAQTASQEIGPLHYKSPFRYFESGSANVYGSFAGHRAAMKSRVKANLLRLALEQRGFKVTHTKPDTRGWKPKHVQLEPMLHPTTKLNPSLVEQVKQEMIQEILSDLTEEDLASLFVYDNKTAVNGVAGVSYLDKIKRGTSAGFPWKQVKKKFITPIAPYNGLMDPVEPTPEIMERVREIEERYLRGQRASIVFNAAFKDEPITFAKAEAQKVRVFAGAPFDATIVIRKLFLSMVKLMQTKRYTFESAPGTNSTSPEWGELREYLTAFGEDRIVEGDFKNFDKTMFSLMILSAFDIIRAICAKGNFTPEQLLAQACAGEDVAFAHYDFFGDLVMFYGSNPSGHPLTVLINGLANCLYMRYCFAVLSPEKSAKDFKQKVHLMTYGDDNIMGVSPECPWFNHTSIAGVLANVGITYTMADKEAKSVPYVHIDSCSFLKRGWRWDADLGAYCAPLEEASIIRSLMTVVESKTITPEAQAVETLASAQHEYFHYGREKFEEMTRILKEVAIESGLEMYLTDKTFRTWDNYKELFWKKEELPEVDPGVE